MGNRGEQSTQVVHVPFDCSIAMVAHDQHLCMMPFDRLAEDVPRISFHHFKDSIAHLQQNHHQFYNEQNHHDKKPACMRVGSALVLAPKSKHNLRLQTDSQANQPEIESS
jgi:hypothetical protein